MDHKYLIFCYALACTIYGTCIGKSIELDQYDPTFFGAVALIVINLYLMGMEFDYAMKSKIPK